MTGSHSTERHDDTACHVTAERDWTRLYGKTKPDATARPGEDRTKRQYRMIRHSAAVHDSTLRSYTEPGGTTVLDSTGYNGITLCNWTQYGGTTQRYDTQPHSGRTTLNPIVLYPTKRQNRIRTLPNGSTKLNRTERPHETLLCLTKRHDATALYRSVHNGRTGRYTTRPYGTTRQDLTALRNTAKRSCAAAQHDDLTQRQYNADPHPAATRHSTKLNRAARHNETVLKRHYMTRRRPDAARRQYGTGPGITLRHYETSPDNTARPAQNETRRPRRGPVRRGY